VRRTFALGATLAVVLSLSWGVVPSHATYPGENGRLAFVMERHHVWQVFTMDPDGTHISQVTRFTNRADGVGDIDWSPDGTKLAFSRDRSGDSEIWIVNADGTGLTRVTNDPQLSDGEAKWSPDGTQFVFTRESRRTGNGVIYTMNVDGTNMTKLSDSTEYHEGGRFTPDGSQIIFQAFGEAGGICEIYTMDPDGSNKTLLAAPEARLGLGDISPDGSHLLVFDNCAGPLPQSIYLMKIGGTHLRQLTDAGCCYQDLPAAWSPDGTRIVFTSNRVEPGFLDGTPREVYVMDADGSNVMQITTSEQFSGLDWGPAPA
jgi:Tol biopolymer transport system component